MTQAGRVDEVLFNPDGTITLKFTVGNQPLPATWGGEGKEFGSKEDFIGWLSENEMLLSGMPLVALQLSKGYKTDPKMALNFQNTVKGKSVILDLTGMSVPITIG